MAKAQASRNVLPILVCAQFIITIDTTFMNVSLSTLVVDLHTTVTGVQSAIALYALVMAAFMIAGAKFGDIIGRKRAFIIGLCIYGIGTTITSLSWALPIFIFGWSFLEGLGASLMLPAMMSLITDNFAEGPPRAKAYATFAGTAGIAAALGPIIGGLFTTYLSWRLAFASELIVAGYILLGRKALREQLLTGRVPRFDWAGFLLSAIALVTMVSGIILASSYGIFRSRIPFQIAGKTLLNAGDVSPCVIFVIIGLGVLAIFYAFELRHNRDGKDTLLNISLLKIRAISAGSTIVLVQQLLLTGVIFALSLYVQMNLGYSAIKSGLTLIPLSLGIIILSALAGRYFSKRYSPRSIMTYGFLLILIGTVVMGLTARSATSGLDFAIGLASMGSGIGLIVSQAQNLMLSSVQPKYTNETAGIINTFLNIGSSLGTSLAGALILVVFVSSATAQINSSDVFSSGQKASLNQAVTNNAQIVSNQQLSNATATLPTSQQQVLLTVNELARERSLTVVYYALGLIGLIGLTAAFLLPHTAPLAAPANTAARSRTQGRRTAAAHT